MFHQTSYIRSFTRAIGHQQIPADRQFKDGETIKGTVIRQCPGNKVLVAFRGKQILANTKLDLIEGNRYRFLIKNSGDKTELKVMNDPPYRPEISGPAHSFRATHANALTTLLSGLFKTDIMKDLSGETHQAFLNLQKLFPAIVYSDKGDKSGLWFSRFLLASGLLWENKVLKYLLGEKGGSWKSLVTSDLKGQLLFLEKILGSEEDNTNRVKSMVSKVKQAIFLIEQDQFQNLTGIREDQGWLVHIPGFMEDGFINAEFFFPKDEKKEGLYFSILLEFTRLGQIEFDVSIIDSVMGIKIFTEDKERADLIAENQNLLIKGLENLGIKISSIQCDVREPRYLEDEQSTNVHLII